MPPHGSPSELKPSRKEAIVPHVTRAVRGAAVIILAAALALAAWIAIDGLTDEVQPVDVAVVLGNRVNPDGSPSPWLRTRLDKTVELYQAGWFAEIIASGGMGIEGVDEAAAMKTYLVAAGIPAEHIRVDSQGVDTYATALNAATLMDTNGWKSALVISQYYHIPRCKLALRRFGVGQVYAAHAEGFTWRGLVSLAREVAAYPAYFLRGYEKGD